MKSRRKLGGARLGAGRPKGPVRRGIYIRVLPGTKRAIDVQCFHEDISRGMLVDRWARTGAGQTQDTSAPARSGN